MMLYKDFVSDVNDNPIKNQSDETVQQAIYNWFKYRYIGFSDTTKFLDILQRNVAVNYPMYQQKLRIEPGVSEYDWLVSVYRERQLKTNGENSNTQTRGNDTTATTNNLSFNGTTIGNGETNNRRTGTQDTAHTGTQGTAHTGTQSAANNGTDTNVKTGGHTVKDTEGLHTTTNSPHVKRVTSDAGGDNVWSGDTQIQANLPMSKSYDKFISPDETSDAKQHYEHAYQHLPSGGLDWSTATNQAQSGHREYHDSNKKTTTSFQYDSGVKGDIVTTQGAANNPDTHDTTYNKETDTRTTQGNNTVTFNLDDTTTSNNNDLTTYNINDAGIQTNRNTDTHTQTATGNTTNTYGNISNSGTDKRTDREQVTGRNEDVATLLTRATAFIENSSAFMWFREQIDSCFYPGYYTDEVTEEGSANI